MKSCYLYQHGWIWRICNATHRKTDTKCSYQYVHGAKNKDLKEVGNRIQWPDAGELSKKGQMTREVSGHRAQQQLLTLVSTVASLLLARVHSKFPNNQKIGFSVFPHKAMITAWGIRLVDHTHFILHLCVKMSPCTPQASTTPMSLKNKNISFKDGLWFYKAKLTYLQGRNRITVLFGIFKKCLQNLAKYNKKEINKRKEKKEN